MDRAPDTEGAGRRGRGLWTDLYELTMLAAYLRHARLEPATFELYVRRLPERRAYLVTAGQSDAATYLAEVGFTDEDIDHLRSLDVFRDADPVLWEYLRAFRFTGDAWAMPEGTVAFANEPILRVRAPLPEAQCVETALLASITFSTTIATKAARVVDAASSDGRERPVVEFGARRAHGFEAAILAARAAVIGGCVATSNVEAGRRYGLAVSGTMAHSWVLSWADEAEAFARWASVFPRTTTALVDTYDTAEGVRRALRAVPGLAAVRLDSGDLARLSKEARAILDAEGRREVRIFASGDLEEDQIRALVLGGAPIDAFGVGTDLVTSRDAPALGAVYKLVEIETAEGPRPVMKTSAGKMTRPGAKQVFRRSDPSGRFREDVIGLADEPAPGDAAPLLVPLVAGGRVVAPLEPIGVIRDRARREREKLPPALRGPDGATAAGAYPVLVSERLEALTEKTRRART